MKRLKKCCVNKIKDSRSCILEHRNVSSLRNFYSGKGSIPYDPALLLYLLFYGDATGVFSNRKFRQATKGSLAKIYPSEAQ